MKQLFIIFALAVPVLAESFYGPHGSNLGRSETSGNVTRYYDKSGSFWGARRGAAIPPTTIDHGADLNARTARGASVDDCVGGPNASTIRDMLRKARRSAE